MRFEIAFPDDVWAVMPAPGSGDEEGWPASQRAAAAAHGLSAERTAHLERAAQQALSFRREGIATSLFFRPLGAASTGVFHITTAAVAVEDDRFAADDWIPAGVDPSFAPVVSEFETDHSPHGVRIAFVSDRRTPDGVPLAGITYGLRLDGGVATAFSELADPEVVGLMQLHADPVIDSLRLVR